MGKNHKKLKTLGSVDTTKRGFECIEFTDVCGEQCSLQVSSKGGMDHVWLGCDKNCEIKHIDGSSVSPRMHLAPDQIDALINHLKAFQEKGTFQI
jgi:hypothetical protein